MGTRALDHFGFLIRELSCLETVNQPFFNFCLANDRHKWIKKLFLYLISSLKSAELMAKLVDCLCQLEELSIDRSHWTSYAGYPDKNLDLNGLAFPNLRVLSVKQIIHWRINITAPRLEKLIVWNLKYSFHNPRYISLMLDVSHPERLKYLQCDIIGAETRKFTNLEHLFAQHVRSDFSLSHFPKLRRLDLCLNVGTIRLENVLETVGSLMQEKEQLKLDHLEITNFGVKDVDLKNEIDSDLDFYNDRLRYSKHDIKQLVNHYSNFTVDRLPWIGCVDYPVELQGHRHLASCCVRINIQVLYVNAENCYEPQPALLIKFLVEIGGTHCLNIRCSLGQAFYDQLKRVPFIKEMNIRENGLLQIDFDFISGIKFLTCIYLEHDRVPIDSLQKNLKRTKISSFLIRLNVFVLTLEKGKSRLFYNLNESKPGIYPRHRFQEIEIDSLDAGFAWLKENERCRQCFSV